MTEVGQLRTNSNPFTHQFRRRIPVFPFDYFLCIGLSLTERFAHGNEIDVSVALKNWFHSKGVSGINKNNVHVDWTVLFFSCSTSAIDVAVAALSFSRFPSFTLKIKRLKIRLEIPARNARFALDFPCELKEEEKKKLATH